MKRSDLNSMTKAQLISLAEKWDLSINSKSLKNVLLKKLQKEWERRDKLAGEAPPTRGSRSSAQSKKSQRSPSRPKASKNTPGSRSQSRTGTKPVLAKKTGPGKTGGGRPSADTISVKRNVSRIKKTRGDRQPADPASLKSGGLRRKTGRKPAARLHSIERPPVRLEETPGGVEAKFLVAPPQTHDEAAVEHPAELPHAYGTTRLVLLPRDPYWVFTYWELTPHDAESARSKLNETWEQVQWVLRIYSPGAESSSRFFDTQVDPFASGWTLHLGQPGVAFQGEIGLLDRQQRFVPVARSNSITLPPDSPSDQLDEEWVATDAEFQLIYADQLESGGPFHGVAGPSPLPAGGPFSSRFNPFKKR